MARLMAPLLPVILVFFAIFFISSFAQPTAEDQQDQSSSNSKQISELLLKAQSLVNEVNSQQNKWTAKLNPRFAEMTVEEIRTHLLGLKKDPEEHRKFLGQRQMKNKLTTQTTMSNLGIPRSFDARQRWPRCRDVISQIQDQSRCGSCWAVSTASVIQDRICIATNGKTKVSISAQDLMTCNTANHGCRGGLPEEALHYWQTEGLCTGSNYTLKAGCKPYPVPPHTKRDFVAQKCQKHCENGNYAIRYRRDKHYGKSYTHMVDADEVDIQKAIMAGGPVVANMLVYFDFMFYSHGVYRHTINLPINGHAVRIVGWGVENDEDKTPYWLVANSWGTSFGMDGYFKIARDEDESWIESWGTSYGAPDLWR